MCNLFDFNAPTATATTVADVPATISPRKFLADGQKGPLVRINRHVAQALFGPEGSGFAGENWVLTVVNVMGRELVTVLTDEGAVKDFTAPNGADVYFERYYSMGEVVAYQSSTSTKKLIEDVCRADSEEAMKTIIAGVPARIAVVDEAMLTIAAAWRCVELTKTAASQPPASPPAPAAPSAPEQPAPITTPPAPNQSTQPTTPPAPEQPAPPAEKQENKGDSTVVLAVVQGWLAEACREPKTVTKHANVAAHLYATEVVDDTTALMLEALITMSDRNRLRRLKRAVPEVLTEVTA